jgi:hypothetical protein
MTREYNTRNIFTYQSKICVSCESSGEKYCNECGLYDLLNSKDEKMGTQSSPNKDDTEQPNFLQDYQSKFELSFFLQIM